jgi:hypothetical protein
VMDSMGYLKRLHSQLKAFSADEQSQIMDEIASHIEDGEQDPKLGHERTERENRLAQELGSPDDLGNGMQQVHRPRRIWDVLLVIAPNFVVFPVLLYLVERVMGGASLGMNDGNQIGSIWWISIRVSIIAQAVVILISHWKGSKGVLIYWQVSFMLTVLGVILSGSAWPWVPNDLQIVNTVSHFELIFWATILGMLLFWLVRLLRMVRTEPLFLTLAGILIANAVANYISVLTIRHLHIDLTMVRNPILFYFGLSQLAGFVWPVMFYLPRQRDIRWAGLLAIPLAMLVDQAWSYHSYPVVSISYILPVAIVLIAWGVEFRKRTRLPDPRKLALP